jgi:hypothetical protein
MSVNARVVLLVEDDTTLSTKSLTLTLLKIRRAFRRPVPFFEKFLGTDVG